MILDKNEFDKVIGEIYKITNLVNNHVYIGQTRSHRLNKNKYRPFGYMGRFKDHVNECNSNKKNVCRYLNSAINKYGIDNFKCEKILECAIDKLDENEIKYIKECNSLFPNGYNLTEGGKTCKHCKMNAENIFKHPVVNKIPLENVKKSEHTKMMISKGLKDAKQDVSHRNMMMKLTQTQHQQQKCNKFKDVQIDESNIEKYIHITNNNTLNYQYIKVNINGVKTTFVGKHETINETKNRAINFIKNLINGNMTKLRETTLEPSLPPLFGNIQGELV
jgi:group I intron endonuclease